MLNIYRRLWQVNWAEQWQYRANLLMYLLYWLVSPIVYMAVWTSIARSQGSVSGLTANDFVTYYMTLLVVDQLTSEITIHIFGYKIQDGSLSNELIRPIHPLLTNSLVNNLAFKTLNILVFIPVWGVLFLLFKPDFTNVTGQSLLLALPALVLGFLLRFLISSILTCVAFWTTRVWALYEFFMGLLALFSGQFVPLTLMPAVIQSVARFLPFQLFFYFPIQLILGRLSVLEILQGYLMEFFWLSVCWVLFRWVWRSGLKKFSAVGA